MSVAGKLNGKALTTFLRSMAIEEITVEGKTITREERLAQLIWQQALGHAEETRDDEGNIKLVEHKPAAWAQQFLWERIEGKAPVAAAEPTGNLRALDKIRELAKERINSVAKTRSGPPSYRPAPASETAVDSDASDSNSDVDGGREERANGT